MRLSKFAVHVVVGLVAVLFSGQSTLAADLDTFVGYKAKFKSPMEPNSKFFRFGPVLIADQFGSSTHSILKPVSCTFRPARTSAPSSTPTRI